MPVAPFEPTKNPVRRGADNRNARHRRRSSNVWRGLRKRHTGRLTLADSNRHQRRTAPTKHSPALACITSRNEHVEPNQNTRLAPTRSCQCCRATPTTPTSGTCSTPTQANPAKSNVSGARRRNLRTSQSRTLCHDPQRELNREQ